MDLTSKTLWAGKPPHQLGEFVPFDVANLRAASTERVLPADPRLVSGDYARYLKGKEALKEGRTALASGDIDKAIRLSEQAETLNPGFYGNTWLGGQAWLKKGGSSIPKAVKNLRETLRRTPSSHREVETIQTELGKCGDMACL